MQRELKGIFRAGWQADYPSIENYLTPLYSKGAFPPGSNWVLYDNPEFEKLLAQAAEAPTPDEANACTSRPRLARRPTSRPLRSGTT